jgi:hypothetical protein
MTAMNRFYVNATKQLLMNIHCNELNLGGTTCGKRNGISAGLWWTV